MPGYYTRVPLTAVLLLCCVAAGTLLCYHAMLLPCVLPCYAAAVLASCCFAAVLLPCYRASCVVLPLAAFRDADCYIY
jgi:hypothetical protein